MRDTREIAWLSAWILASTLAACGRAEPPPDATTVAAAAPDAGVDAGMHAGVAARPTAAPPTQRAATMSPAEPDDRTLEHSPGLTAVLPATTAPAPKPAKGLAGTPGPSPAMGPNDALVKVIVFSDFQCPVCRRAVEPLKKLVRKLGPDVQVIFKQNPLSTHQRALPAARAALAAFRQGKFWEFHDQMFEAQRLDDANIAGYVDALGLDRVRYAKDVDDAGLAAQIAYETAQAEALDLRGTPAFVVNGQKTVGWGSYVGLESQVQQALTKARALLDSGATRADAAERATVATDPAVAAILFGTP